MAIETLESIGIFEAVCADPYKAGHKASENGRPVAGFMCSYSPQELFHAAGYYPVRITAKHGGTPRADEIIQAYSCSFARSVLDRALSGEFEFLDLVVFAHTCDTLQNVADLWRTNRPETPVVIVSGPTLTAGKPAQVYFRKELDRVRAVLEGLRGPISDEAIWDSLHLYEQHRALMRRLYAVRRARPDLMSGQDLYSVVQSAQLMSPEEHLPLLNELVESLEEENGEAECFQPRVLLAGSVCEDRGFISAIEEAGCAIVDDDLCMGSRSFLLPEAPAGDPMDALTHIYFSRTPCPAFHRPGFDPGKHMLERAKEARADGVVLLQTKFCDPWAFDYPHIWNTLEAAGMPTLLLEVEQNVPAPAQLRTRVEAFVEMIQPKEAQ